MCGFAGILGQAGLGETDRAALDVMERSIVHRGPDDGGQLFDDSGIALVHRRLAIIDLSPAGAQPMNSASGRFAIAYNGEIYNFPAIRKELETAGKAPQWRGHSDTEILLAAIEAWGTVGALQRCSGMFAFALWDRAARELTLARDPFGEKPLYYGWQGHGTCRRMLFGSDLGALRAHPAFEGRIDRQAIGALCRLLYIPEPLSVWQGVSKLAPGSFVTVTQGTGAVHHECYFDFPTRVAAARARGFAGSAQEAVDQLDTILSASIQRQMVSDVPLGALLSGGIDSTAVVALMQRASVRPVKTFTIGFAEASHDEAPYANNVAKALGTEHTEMRVEPSDALAIIPRLPEIYTEPFADSSQIPTCLVSRLARSEVTVALSGDAGDEIFGGYNRHWFTQRYWGRLASVPRWSRLGLSIAMRAVPPATWDRVIGSSVGVAQVGGKIHKLASIAASRSVDDFYSRITAMNPEADDLLLEPVGAWAGVPIDLPEGLSSTEAMMVWDAMGYLPGDVLAKVDRAAMAMSLELRAPFLDPDVADFAWSLPITMKIRDGKTKWPLRALIERHLPRELIDRPKMGFAVPLAAWLRGPLRDWAEDLLAPEKLSQGGLFEPETVATLWREHLSGRCDNDQRLWPVIITQAWLEH